MVGNQTSLENWAQPEQKNSNSSDNDIWSQLSELASRHEADPVLHLLVSDAISRYEDLRGVTATIASRYRALVDAIPDAIIIHDAAGQVVDANDTACKLFRHEREVLLRSTIFTLHPELPSEFLSALNGAQEGATGLTSNSSIRHEDGTSSDLEINARQYLDAGRVRIITVVRDLGQREIATRQLRGSEAWLRALLESTGKGVIVWSRGGRILSANPAACRTLQMNEAELRALGTDQLERWRYLDDSGQPMDAAALPWNRALATGKPQESIVFGIRLPGENPALWLAASAVPYLNPDEATPDKSTCIFSDVTALQRDAMMFAQTQALHSLGAWQLSFESHALLCSSRMHAILDVPTTTPMTRDRMLSYFAGSDLDRFRKAIQATREGRPDRFDACMTTAIGRKRRVRIRVRPLRIGNTVGAAFGTLRDITTESTDAPEG
ncbi:PAS domain-containing protein [Dokdonella sp.]|uniref:PAS domain-containing protein n=1 Tax=Dokdonella sp. TaxID=2291710 RepID=UPI003C51F7B5